MRKPIAIGLSPNTQKEDVRLALRSLFMPWRYVHGGSVKELERWFRTYFKVSNAVAFINARSALYVILHCLGISQGDEVILQAFTCVVVPNAIIATGAKPVYVDIDATLNLDVRLLEKIITKKTKAIIVQHTFGIPANMDRVIEIADKYNLQVIEDCAHTIGGEYKGQKLGTFGVASCYSFGRDKAFSSVFGGMITTSDKVLGAKIRSYQKQKNTPSYIWVLQQLLYPVIARFILKFYYVLFIGKIAHFALKRSNFFSFPVTSREKKGEFNPRDAKRLPNALAALALLQIRKQKQYNQMRADISAFYQTQTLQKDIQFNSETPLLRFPLLVKDKKICMAYFAKCGMYIGDWYNQAIDPRSVDMIDVQYKSGSCPNAEKIAQTIVNLPTYPTMTMRDAERIVSVWKKYHDSQ